MATDDKTHRAAALNAHAVSPAGLDLIKMAVPFCAQRSGAPGSLQTIGYGHVLRPGDVDLQLVTEEQATQLLREDLRCIEIYLNAAARVPLAQHEFDALVSLIFDVGILSYEHSFLRDAVNAGDRQEAARLLAAWATPDQANPVRRNAEATLFLRGKVVAGV